MKIHYNEEFNCFETTECHKTDNIELDGVQLIPITELEKIKAEIKTLSTCELGSWQEISAGEMKSDVINVIDKHIAELKENSNDRMDNK